MRVIAGSARSINLIAPKGLETRPTVDKYKETLFNCIQCYLCEAVFVDLFAGSGAIGIEALSRGAANCYFVDNSNEAIKCINENLKKTRLLDKAGVFREDVSFFLKNTLKEKADIIFIDPPFKKHEETNIVPLISSLKVLNEDGIIIVECDYDANFDFLEDTDFEIYKEKEYKNNKHVFIRYKE